MGDCVFDWYVPVTRCPDCLGDVTFDRHIGMQSVTFGELAWVHK